MRRNIFVLTALCVALAMTAVVSGGPEGDSKSDPTEGASYLGDAVCKKCHMKQHRSWKKMLHKKAFENLPAKHHGDKNDDGQACISCHVTGYGKKGGFEDATKSAHLLGVQCEACHGPGSNHKAAAEKAMKTETKKFAEGEKKFIQLKTTNCADCHNPHVSYKKKYGG